MASQTSTSFEVYGSDRTMILSYPEIRRLDIEAVFARHYRRLKQEAESLSGAGVLVAAIENTGQLVAIGLLNPDTELSGAHYLVVGRHDQAHIRLTHDPTVALRHLFVRLAPGTNGMPEIDLVDLRTGQGFTVEGIGLAAAIRSSGHVFVRVGSAVVMVLPRWTWGPEWPDDPATAWKTLPRLCVHSHMEPHPVDAEKDHPVRPTWSEGTHITVMPAVSELVRNQRILSPGEHFGTLSLEAFGGSICYAVSAKELAVGVLVGRYSRCQIGAELSDLSTWSRVHVLLIADGANVKAYDTASTPGTIIDGRHINFAELGDHAVMALGHHVHLVWERSRACTTLNVPGDGSADGGGSGKFLLN